MKLTRKYLRKMILSEIKNLSEIKKDSPFRKTIEDSKKNPKKKYYYYIPEDELVHIIINGVIEKTVTGVKENTKEYYNYSIGRVPVGLKNLLGREKAEARNFLA